MRDVLFRGKRVIDGKWAESSCPLGEMHSGTVLADFDPATVGQYTGLTDKNGQKIFEGDIVKVISDASTPSGNMKYLFAVQFGQCGGVENADHAVGYMGFYFTPADEHTKECMKYALRNDPIYFLNSASCEVIDNIYDKEKQT